MSRSENHGPSWPVARLERIRPLSPTLSHPSSEDGGYGSAPGGEGQARSLRLTLFGALSHLRRQWFLASVVSFLVIGPIAAYALLAVPTYTANGALQVSSHGGEANPLLELAGAGSAAQVETEVEIIRRREFLLASLRGLRLNLVDPQQDTFVTTDLSVALKGISPVRPVLRRIRASASIVEPESQMTHPVPLQLRHDEPDVLHVVIGEGGTAVGYDISLDETIEDDRLRLKFDQMPVDEGESVELSVMSDGLLMEDIYKRLSVAAVGGSRDSTNLVQISFNDHDRETARAVVDAIMAHYIKQNLEWQTMSASAAAEFIAERLQEAKKQLQDMEEELRMFSEKERAVQLDIQAKVTIESAAQLEAERHQVALQEKVISEVLAGFNRRIAKGSASLTTNFFDDPLLAASVAALTEAETSYQVLKATLTADHPRVTVLEQEIKLRQREVARLLRSSKKSLSAQRRELDKKIEDTTGSLAAYPDKELQLARRLREVEVSQRLYSFLLEKHQEAEILRVSTTVDKRIVDAAALPHRKAWPSRGSLLALALVAGLLASVGAVHLSLLMQRRLGTVEAVKESVRYPVYGTVPALGDPAAQAAVGSSAPRLHPSDVWKDSHSSGPEAFRALAVGITLVPSVSGRGRLIQVTSAQPGEGKSTVISNLAVALAKSGAAVLVVDLDLRRPVQHRTWGARRSPGYSDLLAHSRGPEKTSDILQKQPEGVDLLTAGTRLPDTLGALMSGSLESMLVHWTKQYDYVLLDSPPAFIADASLVAKLVDLVLVVARPGVVERASLRQAVEALERVDARKGLVLNHVQRKHAEYYYGGGYYYYNQSYSSEGEAVENPPDNRESA